MSQSKTKPDAAPTMTPISNAAGKVLELHLHGLPMRELHLNQFLAGKEHWGRAAAKEAQRDTWLALLYAAGANRIAPVIVYPVAVRITLRGVGWRADAQSWAMNYGVKVLLDCLTEPQVNGRFVKGYGLGILADDDMRHVWPYEVCVEAPDAEEETIVEMWSP